jgi:SAM-dependent methyltransferase
MDLSPDARANRDAWTGNAREYAERAEAQWAAEEMTWGEWHVPEARLRSLPAVDGLDVVELGCGTGYVSAWLARRGARPVGIDVTPAQLATARAMQDRFGLAFPLVEASAEDVPLADASFDLAISEYGASIWCDPERWLAEAARLLRPGGWLWFLRTTTLGLCATPADEGPTTPQLARGWWDVGRIAWSDGSVEFNLPPGELVALLRRLGFAIEALHELRAPEGAEDREFVPASWARRWPSEEIWVCRLSG